MPAVTVDKLTVLPPVPLPDPATAQQRPVQGVTTAPSGFEGEGSEAEIRQAFEDFQPGRLDRIPSVHNATTELLVTETDSPAGRNRPRGDARPSGT